ncbi:DUF1365 domain-containing protein [Umezawaea endophytica]|uniref:DUF1365 domain-containing protein n=1 Tax=Umezawaea endophytica TaxID=1654476 RepID=A0A9X2VLL2_9PSEU|nr:DUF1365 domain-containing protein [Umezawaea endophytica]MCS7478751.1 DUF1365 domain-containing protein [Umezawaea endophytica]
MTVPALYDGSVVHVRREHLARVFQHRLYMWLVDLDELPSLPWWVRPFSGFRASDHTGLPDRSIRQNIDAWLLTRGVRLDGGRILMLSSARVLGHVFNPLSIFWCHRADGALECAVAEVHNTYGGRHLYLVRLDDLARGRAKKEFYVSPFLRLGGDYHMRLPLPGERLSLTVSLHQHGRTTFTAVLTGRRVPADPGTVARMGLTRPLIPQRVSLLIRWHGLALWLRGLPITPRHRRRSS